MKQFTGKRPQDEDIICALATPPGEGAISLIRISGKASFKIIKKLCPFLPEKVKTHHIYFGTLFHPRTKKPVDEVLILCFKEGKSFTGEESVEISCHGGVFLSSLILDLLQLIGVRLAERGEFSYRAFMNGKIDLLQAESVLQLIHSRSPKAHEQAMRGLKGKLSEHLKVLEEKLLTALSHLEASIDFSDQEIEVFSLDQQKKNLEEAKAIVEEIITGFQQGRINREGFSVILLGAPNVGKSSLFNYLAQEDKAIVTKYSGTTRDILSVRLLLRGREFCIKDSAGFRSCPDQIEKRGIEKTLEQLQYSDLCLFLLESALPLKEESFFGLEKLDKEKTVVVFSKSDKLSFSQRKLLLKEAFSYLQEKQFSIAFLPEGLFHSKEILNKNPFWISSQTGEGVDFLKELFYKKSEKHSGEIFLSTPRQVQALRDIKKFLNQAFFLLEKKASSEFIAFELQQALSVLFALFGKEYNEEVIKQIFKEFCLGK